VARRWGSGRVTSAESRMNKDPISNRRRWGSAPLAGISPRRSRRQEGYPDTAASSDCKVPTRGCAATTRQKLPALYGKDRPIDRHRCGECAVRPFRGTAPVRLLRSALEGLWRATRGVLRRVERDGDGSRAQPARGEPVRGACDQQCDGAVGSSAPPISARVEAPLCEVEGSMAASVAFKAFSVILSPRSPFPLASPSLAALPSCQRSWLAARPCWAASRVISRHREAVGKAAGKSKRPRCMRSWSMPPVLRAWPWP